MSLAARLVVEEGPCKGQEFAVPPDGSARIGRSSRNDIALNDPSVSRFHCRVYFRQDRSLWLVDLGSANQTHLNGRAVQEERLRVRDRFSIGDSVFKVASVGSEADGAAAVPPAVPPAPPVPAPPSPSVAAGPGEPAAAAGAFVDLGLAPPPPAARDAALAGAAAARTGLRISRRMGLLLVATVALSALVVWIYFFREPTAVAKRKAPPAARVQDIDIRYEKVDGSASNVFQYALEVRDSRVSIQLHDLANNRRFIGPAAEVAPDILARLGRTIQDAGFFSLEPEYTASSPGAYQLRDLSVTIGPLTHRTRVLNALEPPAFELARKTVEEFGLNEFGVRAWSYPREELIRLARESMMLGTKLYDERNVRYENLYRAIRAMKEANVYLETVDPKPDFYSEVPSLQAKYESELKDLSRDLWFQADRAIKLRDWTEAANVLQIICSTVPDRADRDHKLAEQRLVDVQRRIEK